MLIVLLTSCLYIADGDVDDRLVDDSGVPRCDVDRDGEQADSCGGDDCDDDDPTVNPEAAEACNEKDDNCDGNVDEDGGTAEPEWYPDLDGDHYGDASAGQFSCTEPTGHIADGTDCDDTNFDVNPGSVEACNGIDDDCDTLVDEAGAKGEMTFYADVDGDTFGDAASTLAACVQPDGYVPVGDDCDDTSSTTHPDAREQCDAADNDCNGAIDDGSAPCPCLVEEYGGHAYQFCDTPKDWPGAKASCAESGYTLTTIDDALEGDFVAGLAAVLEVSAAWWIGANDRTTEGVYVWDDGTPWGYTNWYGDPDVGDPSSDCAAIDPFVLGGSQWAMAACTGLADFICEAG